MSQECSISNVTKSINEIFNSNSYKINIYGDYMTSLVGEVYTKYLKDKQFDISQLGQDKVTNTVYNRIEVLLNNLVAAHYANFDNSIPISYLPSGFTSAKDALSDEIISDLEKILDNYYVFSKFHQKTSGLINDDSISINDLYDVGIEIQPTYEDEDSLSKDEKDALGHNWDALPNSIDNYSYANSSIVKIFSIPSRSFYNTSTKKVELWKDENNMVRAINAKDFFTILNSKVNNIKTEKELIDILSSEQLHKIIPEIPQVIKLLGIDDFDSMTEEQKVIWVQFQILFSRPSVPVESQVGTERKLINGIRGNIDKIKNQWKFNFDIIAKTSIDGRKYYDLNNLPNEIKTANDAVKFLRSMGINVSYNLFEEDKKEELYNILIETSNNFLSALNDEKLKDDRVYNVIDFLTNSETGENKSFKKLQYIEGEYSTLVPTMSVRNANGELQYLVSNETNITLTTTHLNTSNNLSDLQNKSTFTNLKYDPLHKVSVILNKLYYQNGNRNSKFSLTNTFLSGEDVTVKKIDRKLSKKSIIDYIYKFIKRKTVTRNLTPKQKFINDFHNVINHGASDVMRLETSHSFPMVRLNNNTTNKSEMLFNIKNFEAGIFNSNLVRKQFLDYLNAEIERIQSYPIKKKENPLLNEAYGEFSIFSELNQDLKNRLKTSEPVTEGSEIYKEFIEDYSRYLNTIVDDFIKLKKEFSIDDSDFYLKSYKKNYNFRDENGELIQYENFYRDAYLMNSIINNIEFSILYSGSPIFDETFHKRLKRLSSTGTYANLSETAFDIIKNSKWDSEYSMRALLNKHRDAKIERYTSHNIVRSLIIEEQLSGKDFYYDDEKAKLTDGQGWLSFDYLYDLSITHGFNNAYINAALKHESLIFKKDILNESLTTIEQEEFDILENKIKESPDLYTLGILKMGYTGYVLNSTVNGQMYDKFALMPLLPSFIKAQGNEKLKQLAIDMVTNQIAYVKHPSATKTFKTKIHKLEDIKSANADELSKELLKLQINYSNIGETKTAIPTQLAKLVYGNLFNEGISSTKVGNLYKEYFDTLNIFQRENVKKLLDKLGISFTNGSNIPTIDKSKLSELLLTEASNKDLDDNIIYILRYNKETNNFNMSPEMTGYYKDISNLLSGIIDSNLRQFKLNGGNFKLVSNGLSAKKKTYKKNKNQTIKGELDISFNKEFHKLLNKIHPDGLRIDTLDRLNTLLLDAKWREENEKSITVILDRVPTQELNSMDSLLIRQFYPSTVGSIVQFNDEIIIKAGPDFDYDSVKVIIPSYNDKGEYVDFDYNDATPEEIDQELTKVRDEKKLFLDSIKESVKNLKTIINDINFDLYKSVKAKKEALNTVKDDIAILKFDMGTIKEEIKDIVDGINFQKSKENQIIYKDNNNVSKFWDSLFTLDIDSLYNELYEQKSLKTEKLLDLYKSYNEKKQLIEDITELFSIAGIEKSITYNSIQDLKSDRVGVAMEYSDKINSLYSKKRNYYNNVANKLIENYSNTILLPERFEELIRPNSSKEAELLANRIGKLKNDEQKLPTGAEVFNPLANLKVFGIYFGAKNMLGPNAKSNTMQQLFAKVGTMFNNTYNSIISYIDKKSAKLEIATIEPKEVKIQIPLLNEDEKKLVEKDGKISVGRIKNIAGIFKQFWRSQFINATVDAAKDPFFAQLMLTYQNVGIDIIMSDVFAIPQERVSLFLNHPSLLTLASDINNGMSREEAYEKALTDIGLYQERTTTAKTYNDNGKVKYTGNLTDAQYQKYSDATSKDSDIYGIELKGMDSRGTDKKWAANFKTKAPFTEEYSHYVGHDIKRLGFYDILNAVYQEDSFKELFVSGIKIEGKSLSEFVSYKNTTEAEWEEAVKGKGSKMLALKALATFYNMQNLNYAYRDITNYLNFDTTKIDDILSVEKKKQARIKIIDTGLISETELNKLENQTSLAAYNNYHTASTVFSSFLPIINNNKNILLEVENLVRLSSDKKSSKQLSNLPSAVISDFMYSIIYNYGNKAKQGKELLFNKDRALGMRLSKLKDQKEYTSILKQYPVFNSIIGDRFEEKIEEYDSNYDIIDGVGVVKGYTYKQIYNMRLLKDNLSSKLQKNAIRYQFLEMMNKDRFTDDEVFDKAFKIFITDLFNVALAQSGFNTSYISFREFIPIEYYKNDFEEAFKKYQSLSEEQQADYNNEFVQKFAQNNKNYFPAYATNKNSERFKEYDIILNTPVTSEIKENSNIDQKVIDRLNSFDSIEKLNQAWNSPKFTQEQKDLYKDEFTRRKNELNVVPPIILDTETNQEDNYISEIINDNTVSEEQKINTIQSRMDELIDIQEAQADTDPYYHILNSMPLINTKSAEKETGTKVGIGKDINYSFIDKNGVSVDQAAHDVWDGKPEWFNMNTEEIKNEIIDILQIGKTAYKEKIFDTYEINQLKDALYELKEKNKEALDIGSFINNKGEKGIILSITGNKASVLFLDKGTKKSLSLDSLISTGEKSTIIEYLSKKYIVTSTQVLDEKGKKAIGSPDAIESIKAKAAAQALTRKKC